MTLDRRQFTGLVAGMLAGSAFRPDGLAQAATPESAADPCNLPPQIQALKPMREGIVPISADERARRVERARQLMTQTGIQAVLMEPGTNLTYYTGVRWGQSERPFVAVLPARGETGVRRARLRGGPGPGNHPGRRRGAGVAGGREPLRGHRRHPARPGPGGRHHRRRGGDPVSSFRTACAARRQPPPTSMRTRSPSAAARSSRRRNWR